MANSLKSNMIRRSLRNRIFLVGAGASRGSGLPDGSTFATNIFDLLVASGVVLAELPALSKVRTALQYDLRLETFLEVLADELSAEIAFKPFASLLNADPCFAHFAILALSANAVVTTNQDVLLERATRLLGFRRRIVHLHGRCDDISSIVTIVSQYLGGLERSVRDAFKSAIRDRHVVVFGYSGRDRDVMPALVNSRPKSIEWLLHAGSVISPELERARVILGGRLVINSVDSNCWLENHLKGSVRKRIKRLLAAFPKAPLTLPIDRELFRSVAFVQRNKAIAKTLEHLGAYSEAYAIYRALCETTLWKDAQLVVDLARVTARVEGHDAAREILESLVHRRNVSAPVRVQLQLEAVDALRNTSRARQAKAVLVRLDRLLHGDRRAFGYKKLEQSLGWLCSARAGIDRLEGQLSSARRLYAQAERAFSRARDIDGRIDVLTWQSETALISGDFKLALELADEAIYDSIAYAKNLVKAWPWYVKAEGLVLSGRYDEASSLAKLAYPVFEAHGNVQGIFWTSILEIDCRKDSSWHMAQNLLNELRVKLGKKRLAHVRARLFLEQADLARAARDWSASFKAISDLRLHLREKECFSRRPRLIEAHALLIEAECARDQAAGNAGQLLERAQRAYRELGANAMATRAAVALALVNNESSTIKRLRAQCVSLGYGRELRALSGIGWGYYPIQFI